MGRAQPRKKQWANTKQQPPAAQQDHHLSKQSHDRHSTLGKDPDPQTSESFPEIAAADSARFRLQYVIASFIGRRVTCVTKEGVRFSGLVSAYGSSCALPDSWQEEQTGDQPKPPDCVPTAEVARVYVTGHVSNETAGDDQDSQFTAYQPSSPSSSGPDYLWLRSAHRVATPQTKSSAVFDWLAIGWSDIAAVQSAGGIPDSLEVEEKFANMISGGTGSSGGGQKRGLKMEAPGLIVGCAGVFQTDAEISRSKNVVIERRLQRWNGDGMEAAARDTTLDWTLDEGAEASGRGEAGRTSWDQFAYNERVFGVRSTYVDGMYSTELNEREIPEEFRKRAERIAEEMVARNPKSGWKLHDDEGGDCDDEEAKFSAVAGTGAYASGAAPQPFAGSAGSSARGQRGSIYGTQSSGLKTTTGFGKQLNAKSTSQGTAAGGVPPRRPSIVPSAGSYGADTRRQPSISGGRTVATTSGLQRTQIVTRPPTDAGTATGTQATDASGAPAAANESDRRLFKDNINALNLEPAKKTKATAAVLPIVHQHHHLPARAHGVNVYPSGQPPYSKFMASSLAANGVDIHALKLKKKEEFMAAARDIEKKMAKKGWIAPSSTPPATAQTAKPNPLKAVVPPVPPQQRASGSGPTAGADSVAAGETSGLAKAPAALGPTTKGPSPAGSVNGSGTMVGADHQGKPLSFQFNPNASSFTPKGAKSSESGELKPPTSDRLPRPSVREGAPPSQVSHHFELLQGSKPGRSEEIRAAYAKFKSEAYQNAAGSGSLEYSSVPPPLVLPDWPNKLVFSYVDVLDYTQGLQLKPPAPAAVAPFAMPPPPPYLHQPFPLAAAAAAASSAAAAGMPMAVHTSPAPQFMPPQGWNQAVAAAAARPADQQAIYQQAALGYPRQWQFYYYMNPMAAIPRDTVLGGGWAPAPPQPTTAPTGDPGLYTQPTAST